MRILFGVLLLAVVASTAPEGEAVKEKIQAMLDEAALLEQAGRKDEAARVREEANALIRKAEADRGDQDDPRVPALANLEKAIVLLEQAGRTDLAGDLREAAERLRRDIKSASLIKTSDGWRRNLRVGQHGDAADFWRRNLETLRSARKALAETGRADAVGVMERAIHAREQMLEGGEAKGGPDDSQLAELLSKAGQCWRELKKPELALQCDELGNYLRSQIERRRHRGDLSHEKMHGPDHEGGPDDRMARLEERLDRMERMFQETLERLAQRDREAAELQRELDRRREHERGRGDR